MKQLKEFYKYHSLGNDFLLFIDDRPQPCLFEAPHVEQLCDRRIGVGADGILLLTTARGPSIPKITIYNKDGSKGEVCLNGIRCAADYFLRSRNIKTISFEMNNTRYSSEQTYSGEIITLCPAPRIVRSQTIVHQGSQITGYIIDAGNPHFIFLRPTDPHPCRLIDWGPDSLRGLGHQLGMHQNFENGVNVSFLTEPHKRGDSYHLATFERGVGLTDACGSAALSACALLAHLESALNFPITLQMPGGSLQAAVVHDDLISLQAPAFHVYTGRLA